MESREIAVAKVDDLQNGDMKKITVNENVTIVLARINGMYYAFGGLCPHYEAPLEKGMLRGAHVYCQWHHAVFNALSGACEEPPALKDISSYEVKVVGGTVFVCIPAKSPGDVPPAVAAPDRVGDNRTFVVVGGGAAGDSAVQTLRQNGFTGRVVMISSDNRPPYDRTNLNKSFLQGTGKEEWLPLRQKGYYMTLGVEMMLDTTVSGIDPATRSVVYNDNQTLSYDKLLIATGGTPKQLTIPGSELENVFTMRSFRDAERLVKTIGTTSSVAVIGASFIGLESAFSLTRRGCRVTVIAPEPVPFELVFGKEIGGMYRSLHEHNGVMFRLGEGVRSFEGDTHVTGVLLESGERIEAEIVLVGIGIRPATDFIRGVNKGRDGGIIVDRNMSAGNDIYAAGDVAQFPDWRTGDMIRIEHWRTAQQLGKCAALNMIGKNVPFGGVPFFWSSQVKVHIRYVGHASSWDDLIVDGDISSQDFITYYIKNGSVLAAAGINRDRELLVIEDLMQHNRMPDIEHLKRKSFDIFSFL